MNIPPEMPAGIFKFEWIFSIICTIFICAIGISCDIKLYLIMRERRRIQPTKLIPWKCIGKESNEKMNVPLNASIISTTLLILGILMIVFIVKILPESISIALPFWYTGSAITQILYLPSLLFFTIKKKKEKNEALQNQPPKKLNFHEKSEVVPVRNELQFYEEFKDMEMVSIDDVYIGVHE